MNYDEFVKAYLGKATDYDGGCGVQCVDLAKIYLDKVFGIKAGAWGNAHCYYDNFSAHKELVNNFTKIANTPSFVPKKGDICVWNTGLSKYGHIAIATGEGTTSYFNSYDQNWGTKEMKKVKHTYKSFAGVLRPKNQTKITGFVTQTSNAKYTAGSYQVTASVLNVRKGAGTKYAKVTTIKKGSKQGVDRVENTNWGHLMNNAGYICLDYCKKI